MKGSPYIVYPRKFDGSHYTKLAVLSHHSSCDYHWCERIHENCQGKGVCSVMNLVEDRSVIKLIFWWDPWDFFCHEALSWGQQVACLILYLPFQMFLNIKLTDSSDQYIERSSLWSDSLRQEYFNCCLVTLKCFYGGPMG